jgi:hypothetical protein
MSRKARKRKRHPQQPAPPPIPIPEPDEEGPIIFESAIGDLVLHTDTPPYMRFLIFRSDYDEVEAEFDARRKAGEEIDFQEEWRAKARFAELNLALSDEGFYADLYLDRSIVQEDEVEDIIAGVCDLLEQIELGPDGGDLGVYWMDEIANYSFSPD